MRRSPPLRSFRVAPRARTTLRARRRAPTGLSTNFARRAASASTVFPPSVDRLWTAPPGGSRRRTIPFSVVPVAGRQVRHHLAGLERVVRANDRERHAERGSIACRVIDQEYEAADSWVLAELEFALRIVASAAPIRLRPSIPTSPSGVPTIASHARRSPLIGSGTSVRQVSDGWSRARNASNSPSCTWSRSGSPAGQLPIRTSSPSVVPIAARSRTADARAPPARGVQRAPATRRRPAPPGTA